MIEYVLMNGNDEELSEVYYEKKIALNISELNIVKEKVLKYPGTIEDEGLIFLAKRCSNEIFYHVMN
jgi:hypothetical protein